MAKYLNPDVVAHGVANAFCKQYVSSLESEKLDSIQEYKEAAIIYAGAYDAVYDYIINENSVIAGELVNNPS